MGTVSSASKFMDVKKRILEDSQKEMSASDYLVAFSGLANNYCIGLVDICDSTRISANMNEKDWSKYYSIFLNSMARIVPKFGGVPLKNGGDSLLFYFPESSKPKRKFGFTSCIECSLNMIESHDAICENLEKEGLPCLNYRVSSDYGKVVLMKTESSKFNDLIGPPVNMCSKINHRAQNNGYVIGGDFYEHVKILDDYKFHPQQGFSIGLKYSYPIYSVDRNE